MCNMDSGNLGQAVSSSCKIFSPPPKTWAFVTSPAASHASEKGPDILRNPNSNSLKAQSGNAYANKNQNTACAESHVSDGKHENKGNQSEQQDDQCNHTTKRQRRQQQVRCGNIYEAFELHRPWPQNYVMMHPAISLGHLCL